MQNIVTHLWFDREAREAAAFYSGIFDITGSPEVETLGGTPSGQVDIVSLELAGRKFQFLSAGPYFKFTPAVSFLVTSGERAEVDRLWERLHLPGKELMPLGEYPFSARYAWIEDRYGLSWQLMYLPGNAKTRITPSMMYTGAQLGKAREAVSLYTSVFGPSAVDHILPYGPGAEPNAADMVQHAGFSLLGEDFAAMDSAYEHGFTFTEAISFMVFCDSQEEIDRSWAALSAVPEAEQCGWLKDRFGLSWQIVPRRLGELMSEGDPEKRERVTTAFLAMKKFDIAGLEAAAG
jgi:predicted 3-demethylubiquinone-9 3-methyltransferase (glyoxalase superfamily)